MSILAIRRIGDPVLRESGRDVDTFDDLLGRLYKDMLETMYDAPGVGLAAHQVGLALRFFVFDPGDGSGPGAVANPILSDLDGEQIEDEGCLSIRGLWHPTARAERVKVTGLDPDGYPIELTGEGLLARIFQHETDHVNGMLFLDRLSQAERRLAMAELRERELGGGPAPSRSRPSGGR